MTESNEETRSCGECAAPVASDQRYCIVCGAHQAGVPDPAARYLSEASAARTRVAAAIAARAAARGKRRIPRLSGGVTAALVALALAAGFAIGDSSGGSTPTATAGATTATRAATTHTSTTAKKKRGNQSYSNQENNLGSVVSVP
jgi:hypothetical protein